MKNKTVKGLLLAAACVALMGMNGVQAAETEAEASETTEADGEAQNTEDAGADEDTSAETDIIQEMGAANSVETLMGKYEKVVYHQDFYYEDGSSESTYRYKDAETFVYDGDDMFLIDDGNEVYGYDYGKEVAFRYLFVGDAYEEYVSLYEVPSGFDDSEGDSEVVISQEEKEGSLYVCTEVRDEELTESVAEEFGYEADDVEKDSYVYQMDPESLEIQKMTHTFQMTDGTEKVVTEITRVEDLDEFVPEVDEQLKETVFAEDNVRTVTVTVDAGTDQEQVYTQTIAKGNGIIPRLPSDYDHTYYTDAECTTVYAGGAGMDDDLSVYMKSQAE